MIAAHQPTRSFSIRRPHARQQYRNQRSRDRRRKSRRKIVFAKHAIAQCLKPVSKRRFIEAVLIVEIRNDVIATLNHLPRRFGESRLISIDQRQAPRAREMKKHAGDKKSERFHLPRRKMHVIPSEARDLTIHRSRSSRDSLLRFGVTVSEIYRSCRIQSRDSKIAPHERQTGNDAMTKKTWVRILLFFVIAAVALDRRVLLRCVRSTLDGASSKSHGENCIS